jgi:hypothetical protein
MTPDGLLAVEQLSQSGPGISKYFAGVEVDLASIQGGAELIHHGEHE